MISKFWNSHRGLVAASVVVIAAVVLALLPVMHRSRQQQLSLSPMAVGSVSKVGMFVSTNGSGNQGTWVAMQGAGTPFTGTVQPVGIAVSTDGSGNQGTWAAATPTTFASNAAPSWLQYLGDGSDGDFTCGTTCSFTFGGENWYSSFNVLNGQTMTAYGGGGGVPTIRVTGVCNIQGTITAVGGNGTQTGAGTTYNNWGGGGGGGGGGTGAGSLGGGNATAGAPGTAGNAAGGAGGVGGGVLNRVLRMQLASPQFFLNGMGQVGNGYYVGGASGGQGGSSGGSGGGGAYGIILICGSMNFTGSLTYQGGNGANAVGNNTGGGGGGGGGFVIMRSPNWTANTGTINVSGGTGGTCGAFSGCGVGGAGGAGVSVKFLN
jgi:hypothetical protein